MSAMKCIIFCLSLALLFCGVFGEAANPCAGKDSGNWCYQSTGYLSCPSTTPRPCQPGLVCQQTNDPAGVVYCVRPDQLVTDSSASSDEVQSVPPPTSSSTTSATSAATSSATTATTRSASTSTSSTTRTSHKGSTSTSSSTSGSKATPAPTPRPTPQPTTRPVATPAPTTRPPTSPPTTPPTSPPTPRPTPKATTKPTSTSGSSTSGSSSGSWPNGPVKAIYIDNNCWDASFTFNTLVDAGYNLIILAFFVNGVSWDCTIAWSSMGSAAQLATIQYAHSKGARIIASTGGSTDTPYSSTTGAAYGSLVANWVVANNLDGMDFDLENFQRNFVWNALSTTDMVQWVADATNSARTILGSSRVITHAPQPPYFGNFGWSDGYGKIYELAPTIDFFLVQFYNNGPTTTYETIFVNNPYGGSVSSIAAEGIPLSKIVVGKPVHTNDIGDVTQGYNTAAELNSIFAQAKSQLGWNAGVMGWQWTDVATNTAWIQTIYPN